MSDSQITTPVAKAAAALSAGAGTSIVSKVMENPGSFLPTDLNGWMALTASTVAVLYTLHLLGDWYWKKIVRPWCVSKGWLPKPHGTTFTIDDGGNVTREDS